MQSELHGQLGRIDPNNPNPQLNHVWFTIVYKNTVIENELQVSNCERSKQKAMVIDNIAFILLKML